MIKHTMISRLDGQYSLQTSTKHQALTEHQAYF
jgi:hypothetical protein